jgi:hypothetical protein
MRVLLGSIWGNAEQTFLGNETSNLRGPTGVRSCYVKIQLAVLLLYLLEYICELCVPVCLKMMVCWE